jgi:ABC-type nitrate/sulfonate/bicarbonate transport system substrate-binding protein
VVTTKGLRTIVAGFLPLVDAALLVVAKEKGFAEKEGIALRLVRETSWANIRDRVAVGHFQCAHMLAPMPIAARLGLTPMPAGIIAPVALGLGGDAVTVAQLLHKELVETGPLNGLDAKLAGHTLRTLISRRRAAGRPDLVFAVVHPHSAHNYNMRYWLHSCGIDPDKDLEIVIVPPPFLPDALANGRIDGYCVGEPWSSVATHRGNGVIITSVASIWRSSPEKVLGVETSFAESEPETVDAMVRALYAAAEWCDLPGNRSELAEILSSPDYVGVDAEVIMPALSGRIPLGDGQTVEEPDFFVPFARAATFPWKSHAVWFYSQMVRWGHADWSATDAARAAEIYRPDIYRRALCGVGVPVPAVDSKVEGTLAEAARMGATGGEILLGPDGFFDGRVFDPAAVESYIERLRA